MRSGKKLTLLVLLALTAFYLISDTAGNVWAASTDSGGSPEAPPGQHSAISLTPATRAGTAAIRTLEG